MLCGAIDDTFNYLFLKTPEIFNMTSWKNTSSILRPFCAVLINNVRVY